MTVKAGSFLEDFEISEEAVALDISLKIYKRFGAVYFCKTCSIDSFVTKPCRFKGHDHATKDFYKAVTEFIILKSMMSGAGAGLSSLDRHVLNGPELYTRVSTGTTSLSKKRIP